MIQNKTTMTMRYTTKSLIIVFILLLCCVDAMCKPRTVQDMKQIAMSAIKASGKRFMPASGHVGSMKVISERDNLMLVGYEGGAYAVVSSDDSMPDVLGISSTPYSNGRNKALEWWLRTMNKALGEAQRKNIPLHVTKPDPSKYPSDVDPLVTTKWDQIAPYNNMLPEGIYTGCVATAMAQVLNYYKTPVHGIGEKSVKVNTSVHKNVTVTATFADDYYDWDNMCDEYTEGNYSDAQADAVALLMRDCGVAASMNYGGKDEGGSGTFLTDAAEGLKKYFGLDNVEYISRDLYSESAWMNRIYKEISSRGPVVYGGSDYDQSAGHAFVLHGYRSDGKVYVNWGWSGDDDGWYDVATLKMPGYSFADEQEMIVGIESPEQGGEAVEINVATPGTLASLLPEGETDNITNLSLTGKINSTDLLTLRRMAGADSNMMPTSGKLSVLNLRNVSIVAGGEPYLTEGGIEKTEYTTADDDLPERAFYGCGSLEEIFLPISVKTIGNGALSKMAKLKTVRITQADTQDYAFDSHFIYLDKEKTTITNALPSTETTANVPSGVSRIADYAMTACKLTKIKMPAELTYIGKEALSGSTSLREIRLTSFSIPTTGDNALSNLQYYECKLYVPIGTKGEYTTADGWKNFKNDKGYITFDNIIEYGTILTANDATREYGESNPEFTFTFTGSSPKGNPQITCDADEAADAGIYTIKIERGTITDDILILNNGTLVVKPAPLTARLAERYERYEGEENPEFSLVFDGFKLNDGMEVITVMPSVSTSASADSPVGEYPVYISGGETNGNYTLEYVQGTLTVKTKDASAIDAVGTNGNSGSAVYDLTGRRISVGSTSIGKLSRGIYIIGGKKIIR